MFVACRAGASCERDLSAPVVVKGEWDDQFQRGGHRLFMVFRAASSGAHHSLRSCLVLAGFAARVLPSFRFAERRLSLLGVPAMLRGKNPRKKSQEHLLCRLLCLISIDSNDRLRLHCLFSSSRAQPTHCVRLLLTQMARFQARFGHSVCLMSVRSSHYFWWQFNQL